MGGIWLFKRGGFGTSNAVTSRRFAPQPPCIQECKVVEEQRPKGVASRNHCPKYFLNQKSLFLVCYSISLHPHNLNNLPARLGFHYAKIHSGLQGIAVNIYFVIAGGSVFIVQLQNLLPVAVCDVDFYF